MANRHFAKLADVWKHLPLAEMLRSERPDHYCETHAGSASYPMVDDPERRFGALGFLDIAAERPSLADSVYLRRLEELSSDKRRLSVYPGSPLLAMRELGNEASYLFCDLDPDSVDTLEREARSRGIDRATCLLADGMTAVADYLPRATGRVLVHIDPYDPRATGPSGLSALEFAGQLIRGGIGLMYWYGYSQASRRAWAFEELTENPGQGSRIWCGDVMITTADKGTSDDGDLGVATTPGTGFGIICANVSPSTMDACTELGQELARAYERVVLPSGEAGSIDFETAER